MHLSHYMSPKLVVLLDTHTRDQTLSQLVHHLYLMQAIDDEELFHRAILEREKIVSTGIGMGVAIPHAKLASCPRFFIALGVLQRPIEWNALDGSPVRLVFMIGGPDNRQNEYLQLLSTLTRVIRDEEKRKKLLTLQDPHAMIELFKNI